MLVHARRSLIVALLLGALAAPAATAIPRSTAVGVLSAVPGSTARNAATPKPTPKVTKRALTAKQRAAQQRAAAQRKAAAARKAEAARRASAAKRAAAQLAAGGFVTVDVQDRVAMPAWTGTTLDGAAWSTASLRGGVTVVNLWASWCTPCRQEWPELQAAATAHPDVHFVAIDSMDDANAARDFLVQFPSHAVQVSDPRGVVMASFTTVPNRSLPITVVLDAKGRISAWRAGPVTRALLDRAIAAA